MSRTTNRTIATLAAVLMAATLAPSASLAHHDLRSQDALDAARSLPPDQLVAVSEGPRSTAPKPAIVRVRQSDRFDWPSAVMGAAGLVGLIGVSLAVLLAVRQIRRRAPAFVQDRLFIGGAIVRPESGNVIEVLSPVAEERIGTAASSAPADIGQEDQEGLARRNRFGRGGPARLWGRRCVRPAGGVVVALLLALGLAISVRDAFGQSAQDFADWTSSSANVAAGTLHGGSVSLSGTNVSRTPASVVDGSSTIFDRTEFSPPLPASDAIHFIGSTGNSYTLQFGAPVTNPVLHLGSLASTLHFPAATQITRLSGDAEFSVAGSSVSGRLEPPTDDANGSVRLTGTFTSISFSTTFAGSDGIYLQVGALPPPPSPPLPPPPPPPPPPPSPAGAEVISIRPVGTVRLAAGRPATLIAATSGPVRRLDWDVTGDGRTDVSCSGAQTAVRFTAPQRGGSGGAIAPLASITVRALGVNDAVSDVQRVQLPVASPPRLPRFASNLVSALNRKPPVYACSTSATVLTGVGRIGAKGNLDALCRPLPRFGPRSGAVVVAGPLEIEGDCMASVDEVADIPEAERGILLEMYREFRRARGVSAAAARNLSLERALEEARTDPLLAASSAFVAPRTVRVNGMDITAAPGASIVIFPQANAIASSNARLAIGNLALNEENRRFILDTTVRHGKVALGSLKRSLASKLKELGKFPFVGDVDVTFERGEAQIKANLELPKWLTLGGQPVRGEVRLRANNVNGLIVDQADIGPLKATIGALGVRDLLIRYRRTSEGEEWYGQLVAHVVKARIDMSSRNNGGVRIVNGALRHLGATIDFRPPIPLFSTVTLRYLRATLELDPTVLTGGIGVTVKQLLDVDGTAAVALPSPAQPWIFNREDAGGAFPPEFYGRRHTTPTVSVGAEMFLRHVPIVERIRLGGAYFLYEDPGYVAFGGRIGVQFGSWVGLHGGVAGELNTVTERFSITGHVRACLFDFACAGAIGSISSRGAGGCVTVGVVNIGGGIQFRPFRTIIWPFDGCAWTRFIERNVRTVRARAAANGSVREVKVRRGDPPLAVRLDGAGGAPRVRVSGPGELSLQSSPGPGTTLTESVRILRSESERATVVGLQAARPGTYRIELLPGSPPISKLSEAEDPGPADTDAEVEPVGGAGTRFELPYDVRRRPDQRVTFIEEAADGSSKEIGTVVGGGEGRLRFQSAPGIGARRIVAQHELAGIPAERRVVATFRPPSPQLGTPDDVEATRQGATTRVSWDRVPGATVYQIVATLANGTQRSIQATNTAVRFRGLPRDSRQRITVQPLATGRVGPTAAAVVAASEKRDNAIDALPRVPRG